MFALRTTISSLAVTAALSCCAATNDIEEAILSFPEIGGRPDEVVRSANILIEAGTIRATAALEKLARTKRDGVEGSEVNRKVCHLCQLIFTPTNSTRILRRPGLGWLSPLPELSPNDWPCLPFAIVNDVPLSMSDGYTLQGPPAEKGEIYLAYCMLNGAFRAQPFPKPTSLSASNAVSKIIESPAWKRIAWGSGAREEYAKVVLWRQVEEMSDQMVQRTKASRLTEKTK